MNTIKLIVEALRAGADAVDWRDPCLKCGAVEGEPCVVTTTRQRASRNHSNRLSGDPTLSFALRAIANNLEYNATWSDL